MSSPARATNDVIDVAARATEPAQLRQSLVEPLRRLMGVGPLFLASADPVTWLLTGGSNADVSPEATRRFLAHEYGVPDLVKFTDVAAAKVPMRSLFDAAGKDPSASSRWREIIEPRGWGDELRVALRDRAGVWGFLCLHRAEGERGFSPEDLAALGTVLPELTAAFRRTAALAAARTGASGPGVILLRDDLTLVATSGSAAELLDELGEPGRDGDLPMPVAALASRLLGERSPQRLTMRTRRGRWVTLHASLLDGPEPAGIAVVVEAPTPTLILPVFAATSGLTPRETDVVAALLRGESTRLTARRLEVSEHTLQTQIRTVFGKTGVHSRAELVARLLPH
ncbi:MAG TPA: helix-turn-helix transcriptional regulator [Frankiaceae bacterium]|nr:helix-turn-helix transcriptional regulator [Frankiaceae bacterium]